MFSVTLYLYPWCCKFFVFFFLIYENVYQAGVTAETLLYSLVKDADITASHSEFRQAVLPTLRTLFQGHERRRTLYGSLSQVCMGRGDERGRGMESPGSAGPVTPQPWCSFIARPQEEHHSTVLRWSEALLCGSWCFGRWWQNLL